MHGNAMVANGPDLEALTEPTRRKIVALLAEHPRRSTSLAEALGVSNATLARHLRLLRAAGVVVADRVVRDGRVRLYMLDPRRARPVMAWLATFGLEDEDAISRPVPTGTWSEPVLVVQAGPYRLALATERTPRVIHEPDVIAVPSGRPGIVGIVEIDGRIVPVLDLAECLGLGASVHDGSARDWLVVEARRGPDRRAGHSATVAGRAELADMQAMPDAAAGRDGHAIAGSYDWLVALRSCWTWTVAGLSNAATDGSTRSASGPSSAAARSRTGRRCDVRTPAARPIRRSASESPTSATSAGRARRAGRTALDHRPAPA